MMTRGPRDSQSVQLPLHQGEEHHDAKQMKQMAEWSRGRSSSEAWSCELRRRGHACGGASRLSPRLSEPVRANLEQTQPDPREAQRRWRRGSLTVHRRCGGESIAAVGHQQSVRALYRPGGLWWRGCEGQQHWAGVGTIAVHDHARLECVKKTVGGTTGWQLPSVVELKSVQDGSTTAPFVLASVFTISTGGTPGVQLANYWSATTSAHPNASVVSQFTINSSLVVSFQTGGPIETLGKTFTAQVWCERGPMSESVY